MRRSHAIATIAFVLSTRPVYAGALSDLLDALRAYDLNDYALGLAFSVTESPYAGGENSVFAYPYLTSLQHTTLTDDWLVVSHGDLGFRWISDSGWEFGMVGRMQTLGLGNSTDPVLDGLSDRHWSVEVAPMIGYRGWPVHLNLKSYYEVLDRHGGNQTNLSLLWPFQHARGYFVPSVELIWRNATYTDYYFGVDADEVTPARPAYRAGASNAAAVRLAWGVPLTDNWLLSGGLRLEFLGDEITNSPIAGERSTWYANLGLAYNTDIFQPRISGTGGRHPPRFEFRASAFASSSDTKIEPGDTVGNPGDIIDLEDLLDLSESETVLQLEAIMRIGSYHRLEIGFHEMSRSGLTRAPRDVRIGNTVFATGSDLATTFHSRLLRLGYGYSLVRDEQKELAVSAGLHVIDTTVTILSPANGSREASELSTPLPVFGAFGSVELGQKSSLGARADIFVLEFDRLDGAMLFFSLDWRRRFGERLTAGIGYNLYYTKLDSKETGSPGTLEVLHHGPLLSISANFR